MTSQLKPCPFCGSDNVFVQCMVYMLEGYERHYVECYDCGADVGVIKNPNGTFGAFYETEQQAIEAWNTRAERTCRMEWDEDSEGDELYPVGHVTCSACGAWLYSVNTMRFCPQCGARVVSE